MTSTITRMLWFLLSTAVNFIFSVYSKLSKIFIGRERPRPRSRPRPPLPPGTMGWPYIGETYQLYSSNPDMTFLSQKQKQYGPVCKTRILGCPCVMVSSPAAAKFVLLTKAHMFKPTFPVSKEMMLGRRAIFFQQGEYHAKLKKLMLRAFMPDVIRAKVSSIDEVATSALRSWDGRRHVNTYQEMKMYAFNVALMSVFQEEEMVVCMEEVKKCYYVLEKGYNSFPINLPGTLFHKAMKARRCLVRIFAGIILSRRENFKMVRSAAGCCDLLGSFMDDAYSLTDEQITDNIIGVIFAARDTTASVLTWAVKYLHENPYSLQAVTDEQEEIAREMRKGERSVLTWEDTKKMTVTSRVIQETMRMASVLSFTFREAVEDVEYEGYLIPKGWKMMPLFRNIHHDPENFTNPEKFDPSRFEVGPKPNTFMPFGNGIHSCPGNKLAKLEMLVLLHHLTTKYRWSLLGSRKSNGIQFGPFVLPINGLPITISSKKAKKEVCE